MTAFVTLRWYNLSTNKTTDNYLNTKTFERVCKMKRFISLVLVLSMLFSVLCTTVVAVSDVSSVIGGGTTNTDAPVNNKYAYDKTATPLYKNDYTDVTLTVGGDQEDLSSDVVFIIGHGPASNYDYIVDMIHRMLVAVDGSPAKIKLGMVGFADTTEDETVLPLQEMKDTVPGNKVSDYRLDNRYSSGNQYTESVEDWNARKSAYEAKVAEWEKDSALVQDMEYVIARALEGCEAVYRGVNLESALITARDMLAADDTVPAGRKHMIVISTGLAYWFDDDNGNATTIIGTNKFGTYMYGNKYWLKARNNSTNTENGYNIPTWAWVEVNGVTDYQESWKQYWAQNVAWIAADQNKFSYTPGKLFGEFSSANGVEIRPNNNNNYRYGYAIQNADDLLKVVGAVPYFDGAADPAVNANAAHALNYERGQYEAWVVYKQMETPIGEKVETVLKDANGNNITVDGLGFNCYAIANGKTSNPGEEDVWLSSKAIGYNFMHMMGGKHTVNYRDGDVTFFKPIENEIMYALSEGSTVVDYIGYSKEDGYNFDFVDVVDGVEKLPVLKFDDVTYYTTKLDAPLDNATATYVFSRTKNGDPTFTMNYYYGNDGTTDEYFKWIFDETIGGFSKVTLTYSLKLVERNMEIGTHTPDTNIEATLYPIDSKGNDGDPEKFPIPSVEYIVVPDDEYDGPNDYDKSKTATPLYNNRYTDVTLSLPGEAESLSSAIVFVVDKSSSDPWSNGEASKLFDELLALQQDTGAKIKIGLVVFNFDGHIAAPLFDLDADVHQKLVTALKDYSKDENNNKGKYYEGGTNIDAGLVLAGELLSGSNLTGAEKEEIEKIDPSRKHVVLISDGLTWAFDVDGVPHTIPVKATKNNRPYAYTGTGTWSENRKGTGDFYLVPTAAGKYSNNTFNGFEDYWAQVKEWVEADGNKYALDISMYDSSSTSYFNTEYIYSEGALSKVVPDSERDIRALSMDRALYDAWETYELLKNAGYNCYAINTNKTPASIGYKFMTMLNGGSNLVIDDMKDKVFYLISKGSKVVDYIGYSDDPEEGYNFDFIDKIGNEFKLPVLKVGENTYFTTKLKTPVNGATASYTFSYTEGGEPTFTMDYYRGKGTTDEYFIWTINENVSRFAPVSLTYTLDLVERSEVPGLHVDVDTNRKAILYPKDSDGNDGTPEPFEKPKVEYEIPKEHVALEGNKFSENLGNHKFQVSVTVPGGEGVKTHDEFILMVDGSYSGETEWPAMKDAINSIGKAVLDGSGNTQLTLMAFGMGDNMVLEHVKSAEELAEALGELPGNLLRGVSSTNCEAGFTGVMEYIKNHDSTLREAVVVYITDGGINTDETPRAFYKWTEYAPNVNTVINYALDGVVLPEGITNDEKIALVNKIWKDVFEHSDMDINGKYPISEMERAFLQYDEDHGTYVRYSFLMAMKNSKYDKYPDVWNRTYNSVFDLAKVGKVKDLYLVRYQSDERATWMPEAAELSQIDKIKYVESDSIGTLTDALKGAISDFAKHPYNDVVVTDYMSKWVILDPETIKVVDAYGNVIAEFDPENSPKDADGNYTSYVYKWVGEALCKDKAPIIVELVPESEYAAGGSDVEGNANGPIHRITWNLKDGPLMRTDVYTLQYEVFVNTEEPGFEYGKDYPSNGDTYAEYTDDEDKEHRVDIKVPDVDADKITIDVSGNKIWNDANDQDGIRPDSITIKLLANGKVIDTITVTAENGWSFTFEDLPKFENGVEIKYSVEEVAVDGYTTTYDGFNVTNTHIPETTEVSGNKTWNDNNNQDGIRPEVITVNLVVNGKVIRTVNVTAENGWSFTFENLPKYDGGREIKYSVEEVAVDGYTATYDGFNITNTHIPETTEVSGNKTWNDANNQDGKRPASITINLLANGKVVKTITVTESDGWKWSFKDLDKFEAGTEIEYSITEEAVEDYTTTYDGYNVTNSYTPEKTEVSVKKNWNDANNQDGLRPTSVTVKLYANGKDTGKTLLLNENNSWKASFTDLDKFANGEKIEYTVEEVKVEGYTTTVEGSAANGFVITNSHTPEKTEVSGNKTWNDANNQDGKRPESITINLLANGKVIKTITVTEADGWKWSFKDLDKFEAGAEIEYSITESAVEDYTTTYDGYNVTNSYTPSKTGVNVKKLWADANDQDGLRPVRVTVKLYADGVYTGKSLVLSEANGWAGAFTDLDEYKAGKKISYTVEEVKVEGYTTVVTGNASEGFTVTNTHSPEKTKIEVSKVWNDANDQDGKRPVSITVNLYANGEFVAAATLVEVDGWSWTFSNLDKFANGEEIEYTVEEVKVEGYTSTVAGNAAEGFVITNSYTPEKTEVSGNKTWNDANNQDGKRPASITINLLANGKVVKTITVSAADGWKWSFKDLDKFMNGEEIEYSITEEAVEGYTTTYEGYNVINTYTPEKTEVSGNKTWKDANDKDGIRPESITINLLANGKVVKTITVSAADGWKWSFKDLPRYENGNEIVYTITEEAVAGYTTAYDGYNVINTHVAGTDLELDGIKYLDFEAAEGFEFVLIGPDGKVIETVKSGADGKFAFSKLSYSTEGIYKYLVKEVIGDDEDIIYDESVYTVTVTVTKDGEALKVSYEVLKDEAKYEGVIEFNNETTVEIPDNPPPYDDNPDTGDNAGVYMFILALTFVAINVTFGFRRRRSN